MRTSLRLVAAGILASAAASTLAQEATKPGPEHEAMAKLAGVWDAEVKMWMQGPAAPPDVSKGIEELTLLPGGLWMTSKYEGKMGDMPFSGRGISGYDPAKKKFVDVWVDSTDPHMLILEGDYDKESKSVTSYGKATEPRTGKPYDVKTVTSQKGDDERTFVFYLKNDETQGEYYKLLEMTYKRRSK